MVRSYQVVPIFILVCLLLGTAILNGDTINASQSTEICLLSIEDGDTASLNMSTFFGGNESDIAGSCIFDKDNNTIIIGSTNSTDLPISSIEGSSYHGGSSDIFIAKFSPSGQLIFSRYWGGSNGDWGQDICIDSIGNLFITGKTNSIDIPTTNAFQNNSGGNFDALVLKMSSDGQEILFCSYIGGTDYDDGNAIHLDSEDNIVVTGMTNSSNFPCLGAYNDTYSGGLGDAFLTKIGADGNLVFSTYFGGEDYDLGTAITTDEDDGIVITGITSSHNFPFLSGFQSTLGGSEDIFIASFSEIGGLTFSTLWGGSLDESSCGIMIDSSGYVTLAGTTESLDYPVSWAFQNDSAGGSDCFIAKFNLTGSVLFSSYYGGTGDDQIHGMDLDSRGRVYITGETTSIDLPVITPVQSTFGGGATDAFYAMLCKFGTGLKSASYLGGNSTDIGISVRASPDGQLGIVGYTESLDFNVTQNSVQAAHAGHKDLFLSFIIDYLPHAVPGTSTTTSTESTSDLRGPILILASVVGVILIVVGIVAIKRGK